MAERFEVGGLIVVPTQKDLDKARELLEGSRCVTPVYINAVAQQLAFTRELALQRAVAVYYEGHFALASGKTWDSCPSNERSIVHLFQLGYGNCANEMRAASAVARAYGFPPPPPEYFTPNRGKINIPVGTEATNPNPDPRDKAWDCKADQIWNQYVEQSKKDPGTVDDDPKRALEIDWDTPPTYDPRDDIRSQATKDLAPIYRAMDRLIGERVMGWTLGRLEHPNLTNDCPAWLTRGPQGSFIQHRHGGWSPATDLAAAWEVLEHTRTKFDHVMISAITGVTKANSYRCEIETAKPGEVLGAKTWSGRADTMPFAICLACARAAGVPEEQIPGGDYLRNRQSTPASPPTPPTPPAPPSP